MSKLLNGQVMFQLLSKAQEKEAQGKKVYHLEIGEPYFDAPKEVRSAACRALNDGHTHYTNSMGIPELRDVITQSTETSLGFKPYREQVVVLPAHAIILFAIQCLVNQGEEVIYPDPSFPSYLSSIKLVGAKPVPVQLKEENGFKLQADDVEKLITDKTRLIIINSPSNPTGAVMDFHNVFKIAELAWRKDIYVLTDETHSKIMYSGMHYSVSTVDKCLDRSIILNSLSKTYAMTGFRLGYAVAPIDVAEKLGLMVQSTISCVPHFIQDAGVVALQKCSDYNRSIVERLRVQRDWVVKELNDIGLTCKVPDGSFFVMPNISKTGMTSQQFADFMLDKGVVLIAGTEFGQYGEGYVRISYASKHENLKGALNIMKEVLK
jgi:aspartate/methionine/tyrosine aminotransferase